MRKATAEPRVTGPQLSGEMTQAFAGVGALFMSELRNYGGWKWRFRAVGALQRAI